MADQQLFASLIGINAYPRNPLGGCVRDVLQMDLFFRELVAAQDGMRYMPKYFLAPDASDIDRLAKHREKTKLAAEFYLPATFDSITQQAFAHLKAAKDGDICVVYYSGHGSHSDAPAVFWHMKADRQNETIVCVDSRDPGRPGARDILDKELAFLLWDALEGKDVHCLVIMDCCHAGNNTRAVDDDFTGGDATGGAPGSVVRARHIPSAGNKIPLEQYLGYPGFYQVEDGMASFPIARYVHLAAARDSEKALEDNRGGVFTSQLVRSLRSGGSSKSYRQLMQELTVTIRSMAGRQNPIATALKSEDLDLTWLGGSVSPYRASYEVRYDGDAGGWMLYGGGIDGIVASTAAAKTICAITGGGQGTPVRAEVVAVQGMVSVLDGAGLENLDKAGTSYRAELLQTAQPPLVVGIDPSLKVLLEPAYVQAKPLFYTLEADPGERMPDFRVRHTPDGAFVLTKGQDRVPLFQGSKDAVSFLAAVDAVCKWVNVASMTNQETGFAPEDFVFTVERLEGQRLDAHAARTWDSLPGDRFPVKPGEEIVFHYKDRQQPAMRFSIGIGKTGLPSCFVGALYMDSKYGIDDSLIDRGASELSRQGDAIGLSATVNNRITHTIPLRMDRVYLEYGINEVTDLLKIFVSTKPVDLQRYQQASLPLEPPSRSGGLFREIGAEATDSDRDDWAVFTFPIRIVYNDKEKVLGGGSVVDFSGFSLQAPEGFAAKAYAATGNDLERVLHTGARSVEEGTVDPPARIWMDEVEGKAAFASGLSLASENGIRVLELLPLADGEAVKLGEGEEIVIRPHPAGTRDIGEAGTEETIVSYGYDPVLGIYFPLGFSDEAGVIHIQRLPDATPGRLQGGEPLTKSIGGSVKLFFKKLVRAGKVDTLTLYEPKAGGIWRKVTDDPGAMADVLAGAADAKIVLLVHGIFGSTEDIVGSLQQVESFPAVARFVLAFDYENLAGKLERTGAVLKELLSEAGFGKVARLQLSIVAHSMGGLVSRILISLDGVNYVKQLIFAGTPNAGSQLAALKGGLTGLISHAMTVTGPLKYALTGLCFVARKLADKFQVNPGETLTEMTPGSGFLVDLLSKRPFRPVTYRLLAGDTTLLKEQYKGEDGFLQRITAALKQRAVYPGLSIFLFDNEDNDMAVTLKSMRAELSFDDTAVEVLANDHLSYFSEKPSQDKLMKWLGEDI